MSKKSTKSRNTKKSATASVEPRKGPPGPAPSPETATRTEGVPPPKPALNKAATPKRDVARPDIPKGAQPAPALPETTTTIRAGADASRDTRLPAVGTVLVKHDRLGRARCECTVEEAGFRYRGTVHRSLSAAASAAAADLGIKGHVNGFVFWQLAKPARPPKDEADRLRKIAARYEEQAAALLKQSGAAEVRNELRRHLEAHAARVSDLLAKTAA